MYDTQTPHNAGSLVSCERGSRRISSRRVSPKVPTASYPIARVNYQLNLLGTRGPRRMNCTMHSIPASALDPEGMVPGQPKQLFIPGSSSFGESFRSANTSSSSRFSVTDRSLDFSSSRFSEIRGLAQQDEDSGQAKERPLVLRNKEPRWHEQLQCWCLNFGGRVTVASVKNFQLIAAPQLDSESSQQAQQQTQPSNSSSASDHDFHTQRRRFSAREMSKRFCPLDSKLCAPNSWWICRLSALKKKWSELLSNRKDTGRAQIAEEQG